MKQYFLFPVSRTPKAKQGVFDTSFFIVGKFPEKN